MVRLRYHARSARNKIMDNRACPICACELTLKNLAEDHCHVTGASRDTICRNCNVGLGMFKDNPESLRRAATYIEKHRTIHIGPDAWLKAEYAKHPRAKQTTE